jgi:hypothetical protein
LKNLVGGLADQYLVVLKLSGTTVSRDFYSTSAEWSASYPQPRTTDSQYFGNAFRVRQLSFKFRVRTLSLINYSWQTVSGSNYISYKLMLLGPKNLVDIQNAEFFAGFPLHSDMFQNITDTYN